jgi:hypothetical protein
LSTTFVPGYLASNWCPSWVKASFNEAAANTLTFPVTFPDAAAGASVAGNLVAGVLVADPPVPEVHPASRIPAVTQEAATVTVRKFRRICCSKG